MGGFQCPADLDFPIVKEPPTEPIPDEHLARIIEFSTERWQTMWYTFRYTGLRISDVVTGQQGCVGLRDLHNPLSQNICSEPLVKIHEVRNIAIGPLQFHHP